MELDKGIIIEKLDIKNGDILVVTFDTDIWDIEQCQFLSNFLQKQFLNNKIVFKLKGVDLKIKEKGHWIEHPHERGNNWEYSCYECSKCHSWSHSDTDYCPNCGIGMESEE